MKIISWNVNGIQARKRDKSLDRLIENENPDILCIQEIRTTNVPKLEDYTVCINPWSKYSNYYGTAIYTKICPISIRNGFGDEEFDLEGRVINFEFEEFNLLMFMPLQAQVLKRNILENVDFLMSLQIISRNLKSLLSFVVTLIGWLKKLMLKDQNL